MKRSVFLVSALGALLCAGGVKYVDEFDLSAATCGAGKKVAARQSVDGHPITLSGKVYARGIGTHPEGCVAFAANGKVSSFEAVVGLDDDAKTAGSGKSYGKPTAEFRVWADGRVVWRSGERKLGQDPVPVKVPLAGAREIVLETGPRSTLRTAAGATRASSARMARSSRRSPTPRAPRSSASSRRPRRRSRRSTARTSGACAPATP